MWEHVSFISETQFNSADRTPENRGGGSPGRPGEMFGRENMGPVKNVRTWTDLSKKVPKMFGQTKILLIFCYSPVRSVCTYNRQPYTTITEIIGWLMVSTK